MDIIAHRGASGYAPENTLASVLTAVKQQVNCIEIDVRLTQDKVPVICHDAAINRTSNGVGYIHDLKLEELKKYDFGLWYSRDFKCERIPTLEEIFILVKDSDVKINIELKHGPVKVDEFEKIVMGLVYKYSMKERVILSSFNHMSLKKLYEMDQSLKLAPILHINLINLGNYLDNLGINIYSIHPNHIYITESMIEIAQNRNLKIYTYTVNDIQTAKRYIDMGVDGIITNKPLLLKEYFCNDSKIAN